MTVYPNQLDTDSTLFRVTDQAKTRLSSDISSDAILIPVLDTSLFPVGNDFVLTIGTEQILANVNNATSFNVVERDYNNLGAIAHSLGSYVKLNVVAVTHNKNIEAIQELQKKVGVDNSTINTTIDYKLRTHKHDELYYKKIEVDTKLDGKANTGFTLETLRQEDNNFQGSVDFNDEPIQNVVFENDETLKSQPRIPGKVVFDTIHGNRLFLDDGSSVKKILCEGDVKAGEGGGGGAIEILNEGVSITNQATALNFIGADIQAQLSNGDGKVNIYVPPPSYVSNYNTTDGINNASVPNISTTNRNVSRPGTFNIGGWTAGSTQNCIRNDIINFNTNDVCLLNSLDTTFDVIVYDGDGGILEELNTTAISSNDTFSSSNITINVLNFAPNNDKHQANINVQINIASMLNDSGRFSVLLRHNNGGTFTKTQNNLFYDSEPLTASISNISIQENVQQTTFLSGIEYYTTGSSFEVDITGIDNLNADSYPNIQVTAQGTNFGLPQLNLQGSNLTDWDIDWDNAGASYNSNWTINANNFTNVSNTAIVRTRAEDWTSTAWTNSVANSILVNTYTTSSTRTTENFWDESWRCPINGNFDLPDQKSWDSTQHLNSDDACFIEGGCARETRNFQNYEPNSLTQPDYTIQDSDVWLYREFKHNGSASSGFTLNISGTYTSFEYKLAKAYDNTATGGTVWISSNDYDFNEWNNGNPSTGFGGRVSGNNYTFGSNNIVNTNDTMYVRIKLTGTQKVTALSINFD